MVQRRKCGATYNGHTCTLGPGHGGSIHTEIEQTTAEDCPLGNAHTLSYSWAGGMGQPGPAGGVPC